MKLQKIPLRTNIHKDTTKKSKILLWIGGVVAFTIVVALCGLFFKKPLAQEPKFIKIAEAQYTIWQAICATILSETYAGNFSWKLHNLSEFIEACHKEEQKIGKICENNKSSCKEFIKISNSLENAIIYYKSMEKLYITDKSVFPVELLPDDYPFSQEDYRGTILDREYTMKEEQYKGLDVVLVHNLKLYQKYRDKIEETIEYLCSSPIE